MDFDVAVALVATNAANAGEGGSISAEDETRLYALFKQARHGDFDVLKAKGRNEKDRDEDKAWALLQGMSREEAQAKYVELVQTLLGPSKVLSTPIKQRVSSTSARGEEELVATPSRVLLKQMLKDTPLSARPRARSLDLNFAINGKDNTGAFLLSPLLPLPEVGAKVKRLASSSSSANNNENKRDRVLSHLVGVGNARDLGGLRAQTADGKPGRVRFGKIVRCGQLSEATEEDAHWFVNTFAIKTVLDLRGANKPLEGPLAAHFDNAATRKRVSISLMCRNVFKHVAYKNASLLQRAWFLVLALLKSAMAFVRRILAAFPLLEHIAPAFAKLERYVSKLFRRAAAHLLTHGGLATVFSSILLQERDNLVSSALQVAGDADNHPLAFHCAFGKDRTGLLAALLLHALGVSREDIVKDFVLSHDYVFNTERGAREWETLVREFPEMEQVKHEFGASKAEHLELALQEVEQRYGSLDAYMREALKLDESWKLKLRQVLVVEEEQEEE